MEHWKEGSLYVCDFIRPLCLHWKPVIEAKRQEQGLCLINLDILTDLCCFYCFILEEGGRKTVKIRIGLSHVFIFTHIP